MKKEKLNYEVPEKPEESETIEVEPDTEEFNEPEKATALIQYLELNIGEKIREDGTDGENYTINPRQKLNGTSPSEYKLLIKNFKALCTPLDIQKIDTAIKKRTKSYDEKLYNLLDKKLHKRAKTTLKDSDSVEFLTKEIHGISNTLYHLLSKDDDDYLICYKSAWKNQEIPDQREWREEDNGEYMVLTDSEADDRCDDYLDEDMWKMAVENDQTTESFEDWKKWVIDMDGRGQTLNGYDGEEGEQEINGTWYYIYRTN